MKPHRHTFADPYIVAELRRQYEGAEVQGRIDLLADLYKDGGHPPYEIAALAVVDPDTKVRGWIARHGRNLDYEDKQRPDTDRRLDERLKGDADPLVRAQLRENPDILGLISLGHSKQWFHDSSHLERLALMRNPRIEEDLVIQLFDPEDVQLGIALNERHELCCAFLTSRALIDKRAKYAGLSPEGRRSWIGAYEDRKFLRSLWLNAAKWPMGTGNLQSAVYECVPVDDETMAIVYGSTDEPVWRRIILDSCTPRHRKTLAVALQDKHDWCRELAYQRVGDLEEKQLKAVLRGSDEAALGGLADNRVLLPEPRRQDIHGRARARLKELGKSIEAYDDFDMFRLEAEREARREAVASPSMRQLYRRMRRTERTLAEVKGSLQRLSSFYSFYWLLLVAVVIGFVTVMLPEWIAWVRAFFR